MSTSKKGSGRKPKEPSSAPSDPDPDTETSRRSKEPSCPTVSKDPNKPRPSKPSAKKEQAADPEQRSCTPPPKSAEDADLNECKPRKTSKKKKSESAQPPQQPEATKPITRDSEKKTAPFQQTRNVEISDKTETRHFPVKLPETFFAAVFPLYPARRCIAARRGTRVVLHEHLEGCIRHETLWEFMKLKKMGLPGDGSLRAMKETLIVKEPMPSVVRFAEPVPIYMHAVVGDLDAFERIAYEFCEDKANDGVLYVEARYSPQLLKSQKQPRGKSLKDLGDVILAINRGFRRGEFKFGIVVRTILVIVIGLGGAADVISLVQQFGDQGIVGIDLSVSYVPELSERNEILEEVPLTHDEVKAYASAYELGIHRTVHAGMSGSATMVQRAIDKYRAERIGHGYGMLQQAQVYAKCRERDVHIECMPWVTILAGAVPSGTAKHPIAQFAEDGVNFGLSAGHQTITGTSLQEEYDLACTWGLTEAHLVRSNINSMRSSFLPENEKNRLMKTLLENIGIKMRGLK